jgi:hypothetical protein
MPINPSDGFAAQSYGFANAGAGGVSAGGGVEISSLDTPIGSALAGGSEGALTPGVKFASTPAAAPSDEPMTVAMASPKTGGAASPDTSSGFGLDGPPLAGGSLPSGMSGTMMLAGLIGVGVLGAGWAWKSLVV